jgi:pantetheine-phosphate adenylyltransferase
MIQVAITGSFNPPHEGHVYLVKRCLELGLEPIVLVGNNPEKLYAIDGIERSKLISNLLERSGMTYITCVYSPRENIGYDAKRLGCQFLVRGIRNEEDYRYESELANWNMEHNNLPTIFIPSTKELKTISSSGTKES